MNFSDERTAWQLAINMWCLGLKLISNNQINPLMTAVKPQSNRPSYNNALIGTLAVDEWAVTFGTAHPSTASVPTSYHLMWHHNCLWTITL